MGTKMMMTSPMSDGMDVKDDNNDRYVTGTDVDRALDEGWSREVQYQYTLTSSHTNASEKSISTSKVLLESIAMSCVLGSISSSLSIPISTLTCSAQLAVLIPLVTSPRPSSSILGSLSTCVLFASSAGGQAPGRAQVPVGGDVRISANRRVRAASVAASSSGSMAAPWYIWMLSPVP